MRNYIHNILLVLMICCMQLVSSKDTTPAYTLIIFEGSDWCANCRRLERTILEDTQFQAYLAKKDIIIEKVDFPQRKQLPQEQQSYNAAIAEQYNFNGAFPTLVLVDHTTAQFYTLAYGNDSVEEMILKIQGEITQPK